jgi:hypothetical protein
MNINTSDFKTQTSTVNSVMATDTGTEIWVQLQTGVESVYVVQHESFRVRQGQQITALLYGRHAVAVRNDNTYTKIQLLNGVDLLGTGPEVQSRSGLFWLGWAFVLMCPGIMVAGIPMGIINSLTKNVAAQWLGGLLSFACYVAMIFVPPYWYILRPRVQRRKHQQRVKASDDAISELFNGL